MPCRRACQDQFGAVVHNLIGIDTQPTRGISVAKDCRCGDLAKVQLVGVMRMAGLLEVSAGSTVPVRADHERR